MRNDFRSYKVAFISHCIINQNSVVYGLARKEAILKKLIDLLHDYNIGLIQLPCPETSYLGLRRFWQSKEQYASMGFKSLCKKIAEQASTLALEYVRNNYEIVAVIGIKGSPSCGVTETFSSDWIGDPSKASDGKRVKGMGVFMEELKKSFEKRGIQVLFTDVDVHDIEKSAIELKKLLGERFA
ncbi:MAG: hypothetical protein B6U95_05175 [Thermofilum sp. ex4484_82]|nr:MAG: hypothetical protein B6U95_05175 [Thermofilum sp. ex4484_82]OYT38116.1 MAG: hypothetical protein B6U96_05170 [Archaeoglobales archaeon ex4484_92]